MTIGIKEVVDKNSDKECLILQAFEDGNLKNYAVVDYTFDADGDVSNKQRHIYVFKELEVKKDDTIYLYTGKPPQVKRFTPPHAYTLYWGLDHQVWNDGADKATVIEYRVKATKLV